MQGSTYSTLSAVVLWYLNMLVKLKRIMRTPGTPHTVVAARTDAFDKQDEYHMSATNQMLGYSNVAIILHCKP